MDLMQYITENALVLVPVLYIIGMVIKNTKKIPDEVIPIVLLFIGVPLTMWMMGPRADSFIQGVLVVGAAVFANQVVKQTTK